MTCWLFLAQQCCGNLPGRISITRATEIRLSTFWYQKRNGRECFRGIYCYLAKSKENGVLFLSSKWGLRAGESVCHLGGSLKWPGGKTHHPLMLATGKLNAEHSSSRTHLKKLKCQGARKCQRSGEMGIPPFHIYIHTHSRRHIFPRFPPAFPLLPHPLFLSNYRKVHRQRSWKVQSISEPLLSRQTNPA